MNATEICSPLYVFEMDQTEADFSLVSRYDPNQVVGRPIVHFMIDVYSRMIVGYSVSFDNNSMVGMTNCLLSLLEDKVALCQRIGLEITPEVWPSGVLPKIVRCDNGAEYRSESARRVFALLGIETQLVRPGMGSMKGQVEQAFHQMNASLKPLMHGKGVIKKDPRSDHHVTAKLNIDDFEKLVIHFIVSHNQAYMEGYPKTPEMVQENVRPIPEELWSFGMRCNGSPRVIQNPVQFRFDLLKPVRATINRRGLEYKKLFYINHNDPDLMAELWNAQSHRISKEVRIDPRDVGALYYLDSKGNLAVASLNLEKQGNDFRGYSLFEYEEYLKRVREMDKCAEEWEIARKVELHAQQKAVIREAVKGRNLPNNTKNIQTARQMEKADRAKDYLIMKDELEKPFPIGSVDEASQHEEDTVSFVDAQMVAFLREMKCDAE